MWHSIAAVWKHLLSCIESNVGWASCQSITDQYVAHHLHDIPRYFTNLHRELGRHQWPSSSIYNWIRNLHRCVYWTRSTDLISGSVGAALSIVGGFIINDCTGIRCCCWCSHCCSTRDVLRPDQWWRTGWTDPRAGFMWCTSCFPRLAVDILVPGYIFAALILVLLLRDGTKCGG